MARRQLTQTQREQIAENMKERVYATITLLAVIAAHWQYNMSQSVRGTLFAIFSTVLALWLATLISVRMSYRAIHGRPIKLHEYRHMIFTSSGLFAPAIGPALIVTGSLTGLYSLHDSLLGAMIVLLLSLFILSFTAGRRIYDSLPRLLLVSALEMSVGIGIILLKLADK